MIYLNVELEWSTYQCLPVLAIYLTTMKVVATFEQVTFDAFKQSCGYYGNEKGQFTDPSFVIKLTADEWFFHIL